MTHTEPARANVALSRKSLRTWLVWILVAGAGLVAWAAAPADWESGSGSVVLQYGGVRLVDEPVSIGDTHPITFRAPISSGIVRLSFPGGIPVDSLVEAEVSLVENGLARAPGFGDVNLVVVLPDGREELVPATGETEDGDSITARRRPSVNSAVVLGLLAVVAVMWVSEVLPLFVTSLMIPVVLVTFGVAGPIDALAPFSNPIILLFFAGFLMAEAMVRSGLDHYVSTKVTALAGGSAVSLFATMLVFTAFMSMWMSNTAAAAVLIPIAIAITAPLNNSGFRRALVLGIAYAATIGGVGSAIGTPANQLAIEFLGESGERYISFVEWFGFGIPLLVLFLPVIGIYLWWRSDVSIDAGDVADMQQSARVESSRLGSLTRDQIVVLSTFVAVSLGWLTQTIHGVHPGVVALVGVIVLFVLGRLEPDDLGRISWASLLTFGGGLTLGVFIVSSGTSDYLATRLGFLNDLPGEMAVFLVALVALGLTTVASNTVSAAILIPLTLPLAPTLGLDPVLLVTVVAIASSIDFALVVGTPPTMIAYSTRMYTAGQIFRSGAVLDVLGLVILVFVVTRVWDLVGLI